MFLSAPNFTISSVTVLGDVVIGRLFYLLPGEDLASVLSRGCSNLAFSWSQREQPSWPQQAPTLLMLYLELPNLQNKASIIDELLCLWYFVRAAQSDKMRLRMNSSRAILGSHCGTQCWEKQLR